MDFDFKITTWERVNVPKEQEGIVLEAIKSGRITSSNDLHDFLAEEGYEIDTECSVIAEVEEQMTIEENGGSSTIEVLDEGKPIYQNGE